MTNDAPRIAYTRPWVYPKQRAFLDCTARYTIVEAATKTGKTVACLIWLFERALAGKAGQHFWWVAPTYTVAGIAFGRLKNWLRASGLPDTLWKVSEGNQTVEIAGRTIWFKGADRPDSLYGEDVFAAVIDEATRCKPECWPAVRSTLTATRGPVKIIGNVRGRKNWAYLLARKAEGGQKNFAYFRLTAYDAADAGIYAPDEIEDARAALPPDAFKELYLAEPADDGGNPFGLVAIAKQSRKTIGTDPVVAYGVDLAKSVDWTVVCGMDASGNVAGVLDRWQSDWGQTRRKIVEHICRVPALVDSTGVGDPIVEDLQRVANVTGYHFSSRSKQQLMEGLAAGIQRGEVTFPEGWLVNELEVFEYEYTRTGVFYTAPQGFHDDGVMALALAWQQITNNRHNRVKVEDTEESAATIP